MKYVIEIPNDTTCINALKYEDSKCVAAISYIIPDLTPYTEPDRKAIEDEVWEFIRHISAELTSLERGESFGDSSVYRIIDEMSYQEAKTKYETWKKSKEEIHVGDEVQSKYGPLKGIVTKIDRTGLAIISVDGASDRYVPESFYRTGRHFSEIKEIMEKLENDK